MSLSSNYHKPLYEKYRPQKLEDLIGAQAKSNAEILASKIKEGKLPHALMFIGKTGCGKTTTARILTNHLTDNEADIYEYNMADNTGIDFVREEIIPNLPNSAWGGGKVYIFDEAHRMSPQAQDLFLKIAEGIPPHVYLFMCTDSPEKLDEALKGRFQDYHFDRPTDKELAQFIQYVCEQEKIALTPSSCMLLAEKSTNIRKALNNLEQLIGMSDLTDEKVAALITNEIEEKSEFFPVIKMLLWEDIPSVPEAWARLAPMLSREMGIKQPVQIAASISTTCRNRLLQVKYKNTTELIKLQKILRLFARDLAHSQGESMLVSLFYEAITTVYTDQQKARR